ncbi:MAG: DNA mismatch repair protein MutS, partial [Bacilli bacterium]|nr:DNA mismatch repair protein MutS [Bacilli bacterium]
LTNLPLDEDLLQAEIMKLKTREIVVGPEFNLDTLNPLTKVYALTFSKEANDVPVDYLKSLTPALDKAEEKNFWRLMNYIIRTQKRNLIHLQPVVRYDSDAYMKIDFTSRRNLELIETLRFQDKKNTLLAVLDKCATAMGSRYLKKALHFPLIEQDKIERRYDIIDCISKCFLEASDLKNALEEVYDLERIVGRISYETVSPRDFLQLKRSLRALPAIKDLLVKIKIDNYFNLETDYNYYHELWALIDKSISEDAPYLIRDGNVIKDGYNKELDELRTIQDNSKDYLLSLEKREREKTGIKNLKVGYNRVFGYYIEVSKGASALVRDEFGYIRKQTLSNSERFITQELKEKEAKILRASEKALAIEADLFNEIRNQAKDYVNPLQRLAKLLAELDMILSFARVAKENNYVRPQFNQENIIEIKNLRHPVMERVTDNFIPNDVKMGSDEYILLITGPNMSGKSTYMRQVALAVIMAQVGSFVASDRARLPLFDAIYTRIGAADDIISGQSTFMVEMAEVNKALTHGTKNSLILFDEIGRGTATYDGMALAQAILEYIDRHIGCKTLFSTHYHELTVLEDSLAHLKNIHVAAADAAGDIVFLYKVRKGAVDKSYGINVAKLAALPLDVILRATDILNKLETQKPDRTILSIKNYQPPLLYDSKTEKETMALDKIKELDLYNISPIEALNQLEKIQKLLKK